MVSIHAPAWGATHALATTAMNFEVSIHAPAWGATIKGSLSEIPIGCFNPRSRVGSDISSSFS